MCRSGEWLHLLLLFLIKIIRKTDVHITHERDLIEHKKKKTIFVKDAMSLSH